MVFKKRRLSSVRFRRRRFRRGGLFRRKRLARFVKRTVARMSEVKYAVTNFIASDTIDNALIHYLNPSILQGVDKDQRIGNKIKTRKFTIKFSYNINVANSGQSTALNINFGVRVLIIQQRQSVGTINVSNIFDTSSSWLSTVKPQNWRVMYDKFFLLGPASGFTSSAGANATNIDQSAPKRILKKLVFSLPNNVMFIDYATATPNDPKDNYWIVVISNAFGLSVSPDFGQALEVFTRMSYIDL